MDNQEYQAFKDEAEREFYQARQKSFIEAVLTQIKGRSPDMIPFDELKVNLGLIPSHALGRKEIPLDKIIGSVGKYRDFSRSFLPLTPHVKDRWMRIYAATKGMVGTPPIDVYQVGDVYFVIDGNHRVSVARQLGNEYIEANVYQFKSPVEVSADIDLDALVLDAEKVRFLQSTQILEYFPYAKLDVSSAGYYEKLLEHIAVHGHFLSQEKERDMDWEEIVKSWYQKVYLPLVETIRNYHILEDFPGRTEADLYLWIIEHQHYLTKDLNQDVASQEAAMHFVEEFSPRLSRVLERTGETIADVLTPDGLEGGEQAGQWRRERVLPRQDDRIFIDILVPIDGISCATCQIEQALKIAHLESGRLYGLYVTRSDEKRSIANELREEFCHRCQEAGVAWKFYTEVGNPQRLIIERSRWMDLVILHKEGKPAGITRQLFGATFETVLKRGSRPVLAAAKTESDLTKPLLAYDGSTKSREALFVAAKISSRWKVPLSVICVLEDKQTVTNIMDEALELFAKYGAKAEPVLRYGEPSVEIVKTMRDQEHDLLVMGNTGYSPFANLFLQSTVERVLAEADYPLLICR